MTGLMEAGRGMSREAIKYTAIACMALNHISLALLPEGTILADALTYIGYFAAAVMCFFLAEGFSCTSSKKRYGARLFLFGVISQFPYWLAFGEWSLNIMFTLFLCFLLLAVRTDGRFAGKRLVPGLLIVFASEICDWAFLAPVFTLLFYNAGKNREELKRACGFVVILYVIFTFVSTCGTVYGAAEALVRAVVSAAGPAAACLIILYVYNGQESSRTADKRATKAEKWFFYLFYPAHLLAIGLVRIYLGL